MEEVARPAKGGGHRRRAAQEGLRPTPFLVTVVMIAVTGAIWMIYNPSAQQARELAARVRSLRQDVVDLQRRQVELKRHRDTWRDDPAVVEREARKQFGLVRSGEVAVIAEPLQAGQPAAVAPRAEKPNWRRRAIHALVGLLVLTVPFLFLTDKRR